MKKKFLKEAAFTLLAAGFLTILLGLGVLRQADLALSDTIYQERAASDGKIVLVGIDQKALDAYGPYQQWSRDRIAEVLDILNASEDCRPAVIGIDLLYNGETSPDIDLKLAEAAGRYSNVITACSAEFGTSLVENQGDYILKPYSVTAFNEPYEALKESSSQGHINANWDEDGIFRHHMLYLTLPDGTKIPSLALAAANAYRDEAVIEPPTNRNGFWYLPFCGQPGDFPMISVADILSGTVSPDYFDGKIVLIGPYAAGLQDSYVTASDHSRQMYGVEFQANAIQALLWGDYKREVSSRLQLVLIFLLFTICFVVFRHCRMRISTLLLAIFCGGWILLCVKIYQAGWILHVLWLPAGTAVLYAICLAANYIQATLERQRVTNTFRRYVAPEIVSEILKEGTDALALGGKRTMIAVLFVDIRGFTPMSEALADNPEKVVDILNRYLTLISDCILKNKGTLDKFVGDAAMAFWGAPLPQEDFVMNAAKAARDMVEGSRILSEELLQQYGQTVSFGIGIHLGKAVVGNIGSQKRMDYTAIGDTVNTAARLESKAPPGKIYISRAVADALEGRISTTSLGFSIPLKGKKDGFEVLTLDAVLPQTNMQNGRND